jgi:hypothetical protein
MTDRQVKLILDTSAVIGFAHGSIHVGETIEQVVDEDNDFAVPNICLVEAAVGQPPEAVGLIRLLASQSRCRIMPVGVGWFDWMTEARIYGSASRAAAALVSVAHHAYVATSEPDAYGKRVPVIHVWE